MKIEILAPVGSMDAFYAAIQAGADAIYLAGKLFGARAYADNFSLEDLKNIISYAHVREVRVYVTVNTLIFDSEMKALLEYVDALYQYDVDAVIVQDLGVLHLIHSHYPDLAIHASTQMNVHNVKEAKMLKELGVTRIVVAREVDLEHIKAIYEATNLQIEVFVHGALCQSYSGNCLMSSLIGKRSGNRGKCAQPCRLPYQLISDDENFDTNYYLSMKELMTIEQIDQILESNIVSLKIEGRMKRPEYVSLVVYTYKKAVENYLATGKSNISQEDLIGLRKIFNREFTKGYLLKENFGKVVNIKRPNHMGIRIGTVVSTIRGYVTVKLEDVLNLNDGIRFVGDTDHGMNVQTILLNDTKVKVAQAGAIVELLVEDEVHVGDVVYKTSDVVQLDSLKVDENKEIKKVSISAAFQAHIGEKLQLVFEDSRGNVVEVRSKYIVELAKNKDLDLTRYEEQLKKLGNTPFVIGSLKVSVDQGTYIPVKEINELRRIASEELIELRKAIHSRTKKTIFEEPKLQVEKEDIQLRVAVNNLSQLDVAKDYPGIDIYYSDVDTFEEARKIVPHLIPILPRIDFDQEIQVDSDTVVVSELGNLMKYLDKKTVSDLYFNVVNSKSVGLLHQLGVKRVTLSPEISYLQMKELISDFYETYQTMPNLEVAVYGFYELMVMKHCVISSSLGINKYDCKACYHNQYALIDRLGYKFPLIRGYECALKMLNSRRVSLLDQLEGMKHSGIHGFRLNFTIESPKEVQIVMNAFQKALSGEKASLPFSDMTYGHFKERIE